MQTRAQIVYHNIHNPDVTNTRNNKYRHNEDTGQKVLRNNEKVQTVR